MKQRKKTRFIVAVLIVVASGAGLTAFAVAATGDVTAAGNDSARSAGVNADPGPVPADGPFLGWSPQGSLSDDAAFAATAEAAWDEGDPTGGSHTQVRTLFAGLSSETGQGPPGGAGSDLDATWMVLQGRNKDGVVMLAYLTNLDWWTGPLTPAGPLRLIAEQPLGNPNGLRAIGSLAKAPGNNREVIAIGLAEPGASVDTFTSPDWHSYTDTEPSSGFHFEALPPVDVSPERVTLTAARNGEVIQQDVLKPNLLSND